MSSVDVRICVGIFGEAGRRARDSKTLPGKRRDAGSGQGYGSALAGLDQIQFDCPFDGRPASLDVEFAVDTLGMSADGAQGDGEFAGDLRTGKLGLEQAENFQLTLAERLDQGR